MLADGQPLSRLWRYVFAQMLDDYASAPKCPESFADQRTGAGRIVMMAVRRGRHPG
jgi:hypothetical protein